MKIIYPKITVVTPNFNQGKYIETTIKSVLGQQYPNLEYIIIDGGSNDESVEIIKKYQDKLHFWVSEKDEGMYDALNKGFSKSSGEIMCWINSDDILSNNAFKNVVQIFNSNSKINWLQGKPSVIDENGDLLYQRDPVFSDVYFYLLKHETNFTFIQQESTFWTRKLWDKAGGKLNLKYKLAADFDLWMRFFKYEKMYCTEHQLGAFRKREGQKSSDKRRYLEEARNSLKVNYTKLSFVKKMKIIYSRLVSSFF